MLSLSFYCLMLHTCSYILQIWYIRVNRSHLFYFTYEVPVFVIKALKFCLCLFEFSIALFPWVLHRRIISSIIHKQHLHMLIKYRGGSLVMLTSHIKLWKFSFFNSCTDKPKLAKNGHLFLYYHMPCSTYRIMMHTKR